MPIITIEFDDKSTVIKFPDDATVDESYNALGKAFSKTAHSLGEMPLWERVDDSENVKVEGLIGTIPPHFKFVQAFYCLGEGSAPVFQMGAVDEYHRMCGVKGVLESMKDATEEIIGKKVVEHFIEGVINGNND